LGRGRGTGLKRPSPCPRSHLMEDKCAKESLYYQLYQEGREGEEDGRDVDLNM